MVLRRMVAMSQSYYQQGNRVKVYNAGWDRSTGVGTITEINSDSCSYVFLYIELDNGKEVHMNIGKANRQHSRVVKL